MFEIVMGIDDFLIQLVKYWCKKACNFTNKRLYRRYTEMTTPEIDIKW